MLWTPPPVLTDQCWFSGGWLSLSTGRQLTLSNRSYEEAEFAIGISGWCFGLRRGAECTDQQQFLFSNALDSPSATLNEVIVRFCLHNPISTLFIGSDCGDHDSGCFVEGSSDLAGITDFLDPHNIRNVVFAHAASYCVFLNDHVNVRDPKICICPVCPSYGQFVEVASYRKLWWRRFCKVTMMVRASYGCPDSPDAVTAISEPGPRRVHPGHLE